MYNCYNEALQYLIKKYGAQEVPLSSQNNKKSVTYQSSEKMSDDDKQIALLLKQYYLGIEPKRELYYKLLSMNVIEEEISA